MQRSLFVFVLLVIFAGVGPADQCFVSLLAQAAPEVPNQQAAGESNQQVAEAAVRKAAEEYVAAYNAGDAKKLASLWSPEAVYANSSSGEQVVGRTAIEERFAEEFKESPGSRLTLSTQSIQFISPSVALEQGLASVALPAEDAKGDAKGVEDADSASYSAIYVNRDGAWLLDRVTDEDLPVVVSNYDQLKDLEWMIGTWIDQDESATIVTTCSWTKNRNFITRFYSLTVGGQSEMAGLQVVGWDPVEKRVRSWVFDSDGSFGEGVWTKKGDAWNIQTVGTLPDGQRASSVNIMTFVDANSYTWQSINREAGGQILPNVDEVLVVRESAASN